jgi:tetratricopeptide (TPR) repeat protein
MATLCCYCAIRVAAVGLSSQHTALPWYSLSQQVWLVLKTLGFYLVKLLFPVQLCYYSNIVVPDSLSEVLTSALTWTSILFLAATAASLQRFRILGFSMGWILCTLLPVLNLMLLPELAKEHYLYLPSIGFCLSAAVIVDRGLHHPSISSTWYPRIAVIGTMLIALLYAAGTVNRNLDYKSPLSFLQSTLKTMAPVPVNQRADPRFFEPVKNFFTTYKNLGIIYQGRNQPDKAISAFQSALEYVPSYFSKEYANTVKALLASLLGHAGRVEEASLILKEALPFGDTPAIVNNRPGMVLNKVGNNTEAEFCCQHALMQDGGQDR